MQGYPPHQGYGMPPPQMGQQMQYPNPYMQQQQQPYPGQYQQPCVPTRSSRDLFRPRARENPALTSPRPGVRLEQDEPAADAVPAAAVPAAAVPAASTPPAAAAAAAAAAGQLEGPAQPSRPRRAIQDRGAFAMPSRRLPRSPPSPAIARGSAHRTRGADGGASVGTRSLARLDETPDFAPRRRRGRRDRSSASRASADPHHHDAGYSPLPAPPRRVSHATRCFLRPTTPRSVGRRPVASRTGTEPPPALLTPLAPLPLRLLRMSRRRKATSSRTTSSSASF